MDADEHQAGSRLARAWHTSDLDDLDRRFQRLPFGRRLLDLLDHVHALDHLAERGEALAVRVALAAEVELGLVADADEEVGGRGVGPSRAIEIVPSLWASFVSCVRSSLIGLNSSFIFAGVDAGLDDLDLHLVVGLVLRA